ncbi:Phospholipase [Plasmodium coatneyi]|uniref:Phospholipase n=1 Tax=Plasmodium coatneyi TaxID=208452 RepID=A0A1B1DYE0_9APIC|nr:Phospholipase [Plasmodium coatneyi]ANQ07605.1 Phospholipase [Plasmodium coatneyi]
MVDNELRDKEISLRGASRLDGKPRLDSFFNKDGLLLRSYGWLVRNAIGIIILIHGLGSHARLTFLRHNVEIVNNDKAILKDGNNFYLYKDSWVEHFNKNGYSVFGLDLQGHGLSDGFEKLSYHVKEFDDFAYDVMQCIRNIQDRINGSNGGDPRKGEDSNLPFREDQICGRKALPTYVIGISMGGSIALRMLQILGKTKNRREGTGLHINGCISISPMIAVKKLPSRNSFLFQNVYLPLSKCIADWFPTVRLINKYAYKKYPYVKYIIKYDKIRSKEAITYRLGYELLKAIDTLDNDIEHMPKDIPVLIIHSKEDILCSYDGSLSFYDRLDVNNKEMHTLEDMEHTVVKEPGNEEVSKKIVDWIMGLPSSKGGSICQRGKNAVVEGEQHV